jgi:phosphinothricin acetyltransferase
MFTVRPATQDDLPAILAIYNDAILTTTAVYQYRPHTLEMRAAWLADKQMHGYPVLVAAHCSTEDMASGDPRGETVIGFGALGPFRAAAAYAYTVENSVYVATHWRGQGVGRRLLAPLIDAARGLDAHTIIAVIDADNAASLRLHHAFGFVEAGHFRQVGYKFGRWLDLKFLQLVLDTPQQPTEPRP